MDDGGVSATGGFRLATRGLAILDSSLYDAVNKNTGESFITTHHLSVTGVIKCYHRKLIGGRESLVILHLLCSLDPREGRDRRLTSSGMF